MAISEIRFPSSTFLPAEVELRASAGHFFEPQNPGELLGGCQSMKCRWAAWLAFS